jgi:drug/metabolite transporter (DMT)-like permease
LGLADYRPVLVCAVMYATAVVAARVAFEDGANTATVVTLRCLFAALAIGIAIRVREQLSGRKGATTSRERWIFLALGVVFALNVYAFYRAVELLKVPLAILTFYVYPLMTGAFSALAGLDRFNPRTIAFALMSLAGLGLATGAAPEAVDPVGIALALASGAVIAFLLVVTTRYLNHVDAQRRTFWMMVSTSAVLLVGTAVTGGGVSPATSRGWWAIAVVCGLYSIGLVSLFTSASRIGPLRTALMMNLEPIIAVSLSIAVLGQGLSPPQCVGGMLVIAGVVGAQLAQARGAT